MDPIEMSQPSNAFMLCFSAAGQHLQGCAEGVELTWLKCALCPPFLEHLSFRIHNQLFFVRLVDVDDRVEFLGNPKGLRAVADGCKGLACLMPMARQEGGWRPCGQGWGLIDASTREPVDPPALVTDEKIEMTDWELHDFGVQVVRTHITESLGRQLMSSQGNPSVDPSIWFVGEQGPEWVVVRAVRYPQKEAPLPSNIQRIAENCSPLSRVGHFASVALANAADKFDGGPPMPLWRGAGMYVSFAGLVPVDDA